MIWPIGAVFDADDALGTAGPGTPAPNALEVSEVLRELVDSGELVPLDPPHGGHVPHRYRAMWDE
jgi:hypothetical protein